MNDIESLYGSGQYTIPAGDVGSPRLTFVEPGCRPEDDGEFWYCAAVWAEASPTIKALAGVTFGIGIDTAGLTAFPAYGNGFMTLDANDIPSGIPTANNPACTASFFGQIPRGMALVIASTVDVAVNVKLWRMPRRIR